MKTRVWDPVVRVFHWCTAALFLTNFWLIHDGPVHRWLGYGIAGLVVVRIVWGIVGTPYARFASFLPTPSRVRDHLRQLAHGEHPSYAGHNPLGALMIIALLVLLLAQASTGWMMGLDAFWGVDWVEETHEALANVIMALVVIHLSAVVLTDLFRREGLIRAMITGFKRLETR